MIDGRRRELSARLVAGDLDALRAAYDEHSASVYGVAVRVTRDEGLAGEVTQEVFVALSERPLSYDPRLGPLRDSADRPSAARGGLTGQGRLTGAFQVVTTGSACS